MGCCGDKIKKAVSIVQGNVKLTIDTIAVKVFRLPTERYHMAEVRKAICRKCDKHTWMTDFEYLVWLKEHGIEVVKHFEDLTVLPELPKADYAKGKKLFCMLCKCWLPAKAAAENEQCPLDKWPKEQHAQ
jgi:hypothetical protein